MPQINRLSGMGVPIRRGPFFPSAEFAGFEYTMGLSLALTPQSDFDPGYDYTMGLSLALTPQATMTFNTGLPYGVMAIVRIDGDDYSTLLIGRVNVTRQDNAAATFEATINDGDKKPAEYLNKEITITFQAADSAGDVVNYMPLFKGLIKGTSVNESTKTLITLRGYDYTGEHNTRGQLVSQEITTVLDGSLWITGTGTYSTGQAPVWGIKKDDETREDIEDGRDWFADTLTGEIIVPITSNFNTTPGGLKYKYAVPFASARAMIEFVAAVKGWELEEDGVTLADYSDPAKQPVLSLSDESVPDIIAKFLEISGVKLEGNLYPKMRLYSELVNLIGADNHVLTESDYYEDSLAIEEDIDGLLNEQTVRSVAKTFANIEISASETLKDAAGIVNLEVILDIITWSIVIGELVPKSIVEVRLSKNNIFSLSHSAGGQFAAFGDVWDIQDSDWIQTIEENEAVYRLTVLPVVTIVFARIIISYPYADWTLQINGQKIEYGEGTIEQTVEVTGTRPVTGISATLKGDVYEHPWIETAPHAGNLANAILTEAGNFYNLSCERPLHMVSAMQIGDKVNIKRGTDTIFKGLSKTLAYSLDTETAEAPVGIEARGIGFGI